MNKSNNVICLIIQPTDIVVKQFSIPAPNNMYTKMYNVHFLHCIAIKLCNTNIVYSQQCELQSTERYTQCIILHYFVLILCNTNSVYYLHSQLQTPCKLNNAQSLHHCAIHRSHKPYTVQTQCCSTKYMSFLYSTSTKRFYQ